MAKSALTDTEQHQGGSLTELYVDQRQKRPLWGYTHHAIRGYSEFHSKMGGIRAFIVNDCIRTVAKAIFNVATQGSGNSHQAVTAGT